MGLVAGAARAADLGDEALDVVLVAGETHRHAVALVRLEISGPRRHLALLAVYELVAVRKGMARPREEDLVAHCVDAWLTPQRHHGPVAGNKDFAKAARERRNSVGIM